ncbi:hypothetical protein [Desulfomonile tiedjei]|uniref:Uncharacterized protein n=1 Tax=Desulfomonile tiedjei (strain ATCC 49306 / DSM 6799 / DCB-1) TaxID=706587 RepID=I4C371_DESTA|nr:hypothetical protein [Desulfomonile tiedjei]AFM24012.1 hypothetical protein Desti_1299 [Desulfomonile tiedjei DSM 6799]
MNPEQAFVRVMGIALMPMAAGYMLLKYIMPRPDDLMTAAIHFRNGLQEFQRGISTVVFGSGLSPEEMKKERESRKIPID